MSSDLPSVKRRKRKWLIAAGAVVLTVVLVILCFSNWLAYLSTPSFYGPGPIEVAIAPDKPFFSQGEAVTFTVTVVNGQVWPVAYPNSEDVLIERDGVSCDGYSVSIDYPPKIPTYPANSDTTQNWTWFEHVQNEQKVPHETGNYTVTYSISGCDYYASVNCTFIIK